MIDKYKVIVYDMDIKKFYVSCNRTFRQFLSNLSRNREYVMAGTGKCCDAEQNPAGIHGRIMHAERETGG